MTGRSIGGLLQDRISGFARSAVANPFVYDAIQYAVGVGMIRRHLASELRHAQHGTLLDVGAGTGLYVGCAPSSARYVWFDHDRAKLRGFWFRHGRSTPAILGDATRIGLSDKSVDYAMCTNLMHHLSDVELSSLMGELARVTRRRVLLLDPLADASWVGQLLWKYDRGSYPRTRTRLLAAVSDAFEVERTREFARFHRYLLLVATPR